MAGERAIVTGVGSSILTGFFESKHLSNLNRRYAKVVSSLLSLNSQIPTLIEMVGVRQSLNSLFFVESFVFLPFIL